MTNPTLKKNLTHTDIKALEYYEQTVKSYLKYLERENLFFLSQDSLPAD